MNSIKLVPLSIIIGLAGTYFLQGFQKRVDGALATQASAPVAGEAQTVADFALALPDQAIKSLDNAADSFQTALTGAEIPVGKAEEVVPLVIQVAKRCHQSGNRVLTWTRIQTLAEGSAPPSRSPNLGRGNSRNAAAK